jgi:hypothetical protein
MHQEDEMEKVFKRGIELTIVLYLAYCLLPIFWIELYGGEVFQALGWHGYGASLNPYGTWAYPLALLFFVSLVGMRFYKSWARSAFLVLAILNVAMQPFMGMVAMGSIDGTVSSLVGIFSGALIAMSFLSPNCERFAKNA